jgi:hypothetical protein
MPRPNLSVGTSVTAERDASCEISIAYAVLYINVGEVFSSKVRIIEHIEYKSNCQQAISENYSSSLTSLPAHLDGEPSLACNKTSLSHVVQNELSANSECSHRVANEFSLAARRTSSRHWLHYMKLKTTGSLLMTSDRMHSQR